MQNQTRKKASTVLCAELQTGVKISSPMGFLLLFLDHAVQDCVWI